jgi:hypothetical protein
MKVGDIISGRTVVAETKTHVSVQCSCGRVSVIKRRNVSACGRCRACGYANMNRTERVTSADLDSIRQRVRVCREIVAAMGVASTSRTMEDDPVIEAIRDRLVDESLGDAPFSQTEVGIILGITRAAVSATEISALTTLRRRMNGEDIVEELRERDAGRDMFSFIRRVA